MVILGTHTVLLCMSVCVVLFTRSYTSPILMKFRIKNGISKSFHNAIKNKKKIVKIIHKLICASQTFLFIKSIMSSLYIDALSEDRS